MIRINLLQVGEKLRAARGEMTQDEVATLFDISQNMVHRYETGKSKPPIEYLVWAAERAGTKVDDLITQGSSEYVHEAPAGYSLGAEEEEIIELWRRAKPDLRKAARAVLETGSHKKEKRESEP